jgi:hypothetical protein
MCVGPNNPDVTSHDRRALDATTVSRGPPGKRTSALLAARSTRNTTRKLTATPNRPVGSVATQSDGHEERENFMLLDAIHAELGRLQVHAVNLRVKMKDDRLVALQGSLLQYWNLPPSLDGQWLLAQLQGLPDTAGPEAVMSGLVAAYGQGSKATNAGQSGTQLRLFDPHSTNSATRTAAAKKDS